MGIPLPLSFFPLPAPERICGDGPPTKALPHNRRSPPAIRFTEARTMLILRPIDPKTTALTLLIHLLGSL
jgi:hypothetical protein